MIAQLVFLPSTFEEAKNQIGRRTKGSVRKKGKKWYGRFYIEDESGRKVQKEFAGTESKAETEAICFPAAQSRKMCRNFSGTPMPVPQ